MKRECPDKNVLGLPKALPRGVFVIGSQRPVSVPLVVDRTPRQIIHLAADHPENLNDLRFFLEKALSWPEVAKGVGTGTSRKAQFISRLSSKCRHGYTYISS